MVKSSYVYPKDAEAPPCGMDDMTNLAYFHEPVVLQNLKSRFDINEDYGDYDSDDGDFGSEPLREVDPYYNPEEYADLWGFNTKSNTKYTKKCCFDGLRVRILILILFPFFSLFLLLLLLSSKGFLFGTGQKSFKRYCVAQFFCGLHLVARTAL